ncbi:MAG: VWA domain-containing protein [Chitinophagales bacterium]
MSPVKLFFYGLIFLLLCVFSLSAQDAYSEKYFAQKTRILLILDASGSMNETWEGQQRFEISKSILSNMVDSVEASNKDVEFALRIFGHQSHKDERNCKDSKLEIPFGTNNSKKIKAKLASVEPQGWTPIAYSLLQAADDFTNVPGVKNAIILVTDGLENCGGDLCAVAEALQNKRITLKPFIIGVDIQENAFPEFDCVGYYFDVSTKDAYKVVLDKVISQALNTTTVQIDLLDEAKKAKITDLNISIYDSKSGILIYNFIHTFNKNELADTLLLDPVGRYDFVVNCIPPVEKNDVELIAGKHNIIKIEAPQGHLYLSTADGQSHSNTKCLVMRKGKNEILYAQRINSRQRYHSGIYDLELLTLPRIRMNGIKIGGDKIKEIRIAAPGTLSTYGKTDQKATIFKDDIDMTWVAELENINGKNQLHLQPGAYKLLLQPANSEHTEDSKVIDFSIESNAENVLRF